MKDLGLLMLIAVTLFGASCRKQETSAANMNSAAVDSTKVESSNQNTAPVVSEPKGLKPSEPCAWFAKSLGMTPQEYKQNSSNPSLYHCTQRRFLVNSSSFEFAALGGETNIKELKLAIVATPKNSAKQNAGLNKMLALASMEVAERAGGQKLDEEIIKTILAGETKTFSLKPGGDSINPQPKMVLVQNVDAPGSSSSFLYARNVSFVF